MPRDLPHVNDHASARLRHPDAMLPVPLPDRVWTLARRAFATGLVEQLPLRARFLDILEHLNRGHLLALIGTTVPTVWLDGYPDVALLAGVLFTYGYVQIAGRHRDNPQVVYFTLSETGRRKMREGRKWWNKLSFLQRLQVRLFG
jgi:hypothetical protein